MLLNLLQVRFSRGPKGKRRVQTEERSSDSKATPTEAPPNVPKITRLLVLGYHFERLVRDGVVKDYAEIARLTGLSRARVTQIVNLTMFAPEIQERILLVDKVEALGRATHEQGFCQVVKHVEWGRQIVSHG